MRVLIACEESQRVCMEFRKLGHEAYSCDVEECSGGHPEWHIQADVLPLINGHCSFRTMDGTEHRICGKWDMIIAHPPCTYLSNAGARFLYPKGVLNEDRLNLGLQAKTFFMAIYNADCERIAIENPIPSKIYELPPYTQTIQPYEYGHPYQKKTCLWLKNIPVLQPTDIVPKEDRQSTKIAGNWFNKGGKDRQKNRAKTFEGIAKAMAQQWGNTRNMLDFGYYNMDCMDGMKQFPDKYFDLAIVDPPYGIGEGDKRNHFSRGVLAKGQEYKRFYDKEPPSKEYFIELSRVSKNQIIFGANHFADRLPNPSSRCWIVWDKDNGENDFADCELAWTSFDTAVRKFKYRWQGMLQENMKNKEIRIHPTQKPVALYEWILNRYAKAGDIILDTHVGSASSLIACHNTNHRFVGFECDEYYYKASKERFAAETAQMNLFEFIK